MAFAGSIKKKALDPPSLNEEWETEITAVVQTAPGLSCLPCPLDVCHSRFFFEVGESCIEMKTVYRLNSGVQVRAEKFGLLFYDYRGPRLYFVPTKNLIDPAFFDGGQTVENLTASICACHRQPHRSSRLWVQQVLAQLEQKGLIHGQPIC
jgi:putative mycofactocin binding protein MftB